MAIRIENQLSPEHYASIGRRFAAFVIDSFILATLVAIGAHLLPILGGVIVWVLYAPTLESSAMKATIGKNWLGIEVVDEIGRRITFRAALIRNLLKIVSFAILALGFVIAMFTERRQALHDLLAETFVIYGRDERSLGEAWVENVKEVYASLRESFSGARPKRDPLVELERLQALRDRGTLSETEFQAAKSRILGDI